MPSAEITYTHLLQEFFTKILDDEISFKGQKEREWISGQVL
jgi:hypothetical protein